MKRGAVCSEKEKGEEKTLPSRFFLKRFVSSQRERVELERRVAPEGGFALVTVLLLASLLLVVLIGLLFLTEEEGQRSSSYLEQEKAGTIVETALAEVKAKLMDGGEIPYKDGVATASMTACPGLMEVRRYDVLPNRGYQVGREAFMDRNSFFRKPFAKEYEREGRGDWQPANPQWIALYSQKWYAPFCQYMTAERAGGGEHPNGLRDKNPDYDPAWVFNLNTKDNPFCSGRLYFGGVEGKSVGIKNISLEGDYAKRGKEESYRYQPGESNAERPLYVQWIPLYRDPQYGVMKPDGERNPIVGRYAYWVDVENTKVNINNIKREWRQTALGELTGMSDAARGKWRGSYFEQWGEEEKDTPRVTAESYLVRSYKLFRDEVNTDYGVELYYRSNYGRAEGEDRSREFYERRVFGWEGGKLPPAIADTGVLDSKAFSGLQSYMKGEKVTWLDTLVGRSTVVYNIVNEVRGVLDPYVEENSGQRGQLGLKGFEKMYGQGLTVYGWDEERDPLGRPKLDINAILREGDALFDEGKRLPEPDHRGTALQQFLARLNDPRYYKAYYCGAYPSGGKELSFVDSLKAFAGEGADKESYAKAMCEQMVTNMVEYGRDHEDPPYIDKERGIVGAKSMPYVAEIALRARNGLWDLWDYPLRPYEPSAEIITDVFSPDYTTESYFPGVEENELLYSDDNFNKKKQSFMEDIRLAQRITYYLLKGNPGDATKVSNQLYGVSADNLNNNTLGGGYTASNPGFNYAVTQLRNLLYYVVVDSAVALVNPSPLGGRETSHWEIEMDYSWFDPKKGDWPSAVYTDIEEVNPVFLGADGTEKRTLKAMSKSKYFSPYLFPGKGYQVDKLGYLFGVNDHSRDVHNIIYFRPRPKALRDKDPVTFSPIGEFDSGMIPGDLVDGFKENMGGIKEGVHQPFRLRGWRIYRKDQSYPGGRALYHEVPIRHPGQVSEPREFWQMTVDRDGDGPEFPPNCGVVASTKLSHYGLPTKEFRYPDVHALEHFRRPAEVPIRNLNSRGRKQELALPFGLGSDAQIDENWKALKERKHVAMSWFSSQTIMEFAKHCESLMATIPPVPGQKEKLAVVDSFDDEHVFFFHTPEDPNYFYHVEEYLAKGDEEEGILPQPPFRGLEGKLYMPERAIDVLLDWLSSEAGQSEQAIAKAEAISDHNKARSDILRFILLQMKLRDEAMHHKRIVQETGREQASTGRSEDDDFVSGMALVERLVCIDPVLGHRTGDCDKLVERDGETYCGHFYGCNGHPWRRYNYYFHHYDKGDASPQAEVLGDYQRPEPDRALTGYFSDPRRTDGESEPEYTETSDSATWGGKPYTFHYEAFKRRKVPLNALTGSVLQNVILTKGERLPDLRGEKGWAQVSDLEESSSNVWPYGPGMEVSYGYHRGKPAHERMKFRNGSFLTHMPRGERMTSIGEIGLCHSGFLQRTIDLDRPPMLPVKGVKRLGAPEYGPPMSMLLDLLTPSNFRDKKGNYLNKEDWDEGKYRPHSPENPRRGTWNINSRMAHDNYLAIREGAHGVLTNDGETFFANNLDKAAVHPALVPSVIGTKKRNREIVEGNYVLDPYLSPLVHFRRGWEQWLGAIAGDYSEHRNLRGGVWNKHKGQIDVSMDVYAIAQGTLSFSWHSGGTKKGAGSFIQFSEKEEKASGLLALGRETEKKGLGGHVSGDGPMEMEDGEWGMENGEKKAVYPVEKGDNVSLFDVTRYGLFPLYHHISEVGYSGLGKMYTALNHRSRTTSVHGGFEFEEELVDEEIGGDGIWGAMSQAGFARNAPWVMVANQASTSANVFTIHIVTQSLRERKGTHSIERTKNQELRTKNEITGEQWAQVVVGRVPRRNKRGEILKDRQGAPRYDYHILSKKVLASER